MAEIIKHMSNIFIVPKECREKYFDIIGSLNRLGIASAGIGEVYTPYRLAYPDPNFHLVFYSISGEGRFETDDLVGKFKPGHIFFSPAHKYHHYWTDGSYEMLWFHLEDSEQWSFLRGTTAFQKPAEWIKQIIAASEGYLEELTSTAIDAEQAADHYGDLIGTYLYRELRTNETYGEQQARRMLDDLRRLVHQNLKHDWKVEELANAAHVSPVQLNRIMSKYYNTTPIGMVRDLRMQRAIDLLIHTNYPLKLVAERLGYNTPFSFSKAFRKHTGESPGIFRKKKLGHAATTNNTNPHE
jgi:AraC-like DNA-binding protein